MRDGDRVLADLALAVGRKCVHGTRARELDSLGIGVRQLCTEIHETQLLPLSRVEDKGHSVSIDRYAVTGDLHLCGET